MAYLGVLEHLGGERCDSFDAIQHRHDIIDNYQIPVHPSQAEQQDLWDDDYQQISFSFALQPLSKKSNPLAKVVTQAPKLANWAFKHLS